MTTSENNIWSLIALSIIAAALVISGTGWAMRQPMTESRSTVSAPGVDVHTRGDDVKIDAPYTSIHKDGSGTRIKAPGVDIELPP
jgi:hypothetical protein